MMDPTSPVHWDMERWSLLVELAAQLEMGFGKCVQKLLALGFLEAGAERVTERSIQGIDLEVEWGGRRLALEVKTCQSAAVTLGAKDIRGLLARVAEGLDGYVAVLGLRPTDRWILARFHPSELPPQRPVPIDGFRSWREPGLEQALEPAFGAVVRQSAPDVLRFGPAHLDAALRDHGRFHSA